MFDPLVSLEDVGVRAGGTTILSGVSLTVSPGESVGVAGPNGIGKTTLLRVVATLLRPSSGRALVLGRDSRQVDRRTRSLIGLSGHQPALYPELTLAENLRFVARMGGWTRSAADDALDRVGLGGVAHRRAGLASHGMQRRVDLARMILVNPLLLLLDEAHAGLDRQADPIIEALVARCLARGGAAILVSHDRDRLSSQVGRIIDLKVPS